MKKVIKKLVFLDTETTGTQLEDRIIQVAFKTKDESWEGLFKPSLPVKIEAMAVCHITNKMLENAQDFQGSELQKKMIDLFEDKNTVLIAHNAKFDIEMLKRGGVEVKNHICTYKIAQYLDKEAVVPKYNLQYLRYFLNLDIEANAHDAMGDVLVLEGLFERLFDKFFTQTDVEIPFATDDDAIDGMISVSKNPILIKKFPFGKHEGEKIVDVADSDKNYLQWLLGQKQKEDMPDEDWIYTLNRYI